MDEKQIESYLYAEMPESEREKLEDRFVSDDELFAEIVDRENELVDAYVRDYLSAGERKRFEQSLASFPARREKISNAKLLREFIATERQEPSTITIAERSSYFSQLAQMISFRSSAIRFASVGLILLLGLFSLFLLRENRRLSSLEGELAASQQRASELAAEIESEREASGDLVADLSAERDRIESLKSEIEKLRRTNTNESIAQGPSPTIATLLLSPAAIRSGPPGMPSLKIRGGVSRVAVSIEIPAEPEEIDGVTVRLNGEVVASSVRLRTRDGERIATVFIPVAKFKPGRNKFEVVDRDGKVIASYPVARIEDR